MISDWLVSHQTANKSSSNRLISNLNDECWKVLGWVNCSDQFVASRKSNRKSDSNYLGKLAFFGTNNAHTLPRTRHEKKARSRSTSAFLSLAFAIRLGLRKSRENWYVRASSQPLDHSAIKSTFEFISVEFHPQSSTLRLTHARGGAFKMFSNVVTQHKLQSLVTTNLSKLCLPNPTWQKLP